jgi:hypothetical protein
MVGFPHSEIPGSKLIRSSPRLIAAYYVLHRLHTPRHPLDALKTLDRSHYQCPQPQRPQPLLCSAETSVIGLSLSDASRRRLLIGQIKKNLYLTLPSCASPRVSGQAAQKAISLRCQNIRSWILRRINTTKPCSLLYAASCLSLRHTTRRADAPKERRLVEPDGIEPTTSCLQSRRSPS